MRLAIGKIWVFGSSEIALSVRLFKLFAMRANSRLSNLNLTQRPRQPQMRRKERVDGIAKVWGLIVGVCSFCFACSGQQSNTPVAENESAVRARRLYWEAEARHKKEPKNVEAGWQFGRACFDFAEFSTNSTERAQIAEQGIAACKQALTQNRDLAVAHYYLGMNIGELAQTRGLSALKLVDQMEKEFELARTLDELL